MVLRKARSLVVAEDAAVVDWIGQLASKTGDTTLLHPADLEDLLQRIEACPALDFLFVQFTPANMDDQAVWVERVLERFPEIIVIGVADQPLQEVTLAAMRAGCRDFFVIGRDDAMAAARLPKLLRRGGPSVRGAAPLGKTVVLLSPHPSESGAFTGVHLALALKERFPRETDKILLLDLATPAAAATIFLNLNPPYSALDAINDAYRCDATLIESAFEKHIAGIYVLSLPETLVARPQFNGEDLLRLLKVLRSYFAMTVVTLDAQTQIEVLAAVITHADRSLLVTDQSILRSRRSKQVLRALRDDNCPLDRMALVIDNYRPRLGLEPADLSSLLDLPLMALLDGRLEHRIQSMNAGQPLLTLAPRDAYCRAIRHLAAVTLDGGEVPMATASRGGLLARLLGEAR